MPPRPNPSPMLPTEFEIRMPSGVTPTWQTTSNETAKQGNRMIDAMKPEFFARTGSGHASSSCSPEEEWPDAR